MDSQEPQDSQGASQDEGDSPSGQPERVFAPLPQIRDERRSARRAQVWLAVIAVMCVLAAGAFGVSRLASRGRAATSTATAPLTAEQAQQATQQALATRQAQNGPQYQITGISMDSPTDGWAIAASRGPDMGSGDIAYHIVNGQISKTGTLAGLGPGDVTLQALAPNDVWVMGQGGSTLYHYDGSAWVQEGLPSGIEQGGLSILNAMRFVSPSLGWMVATASTPAATPSATSAPKLVFYRYDGSAWSAEPADAAASNTGVPIAGQPGASAGIQVTGLSVTASDDAWATGFVGVPANNSNNGFAVNVTGYLYHRVGGVWHVRTLPGYELDGIQMTGPASGWMIGKRYQTHTISGPPGVPSYTVTSQTPTLLRWDGAQWTPEQPSAITSALQNGSLNQITASGPNDVWVTGVLSGLELSSSGGAYVNTSSDLLLHFDGARWSRVTLPQIRALNAATGATGATTNDGASLDVLSALPSGELWAAGVVYHGASGVYQAAPLVFRYADGKWNAIMAPWV